MAVPASGITIQVQNGTQYYFDLAPVPENHHVEASPLGKEGMIDFGQDDWSGGLLSAYEGYIYDESIPNKYLSAKGTDAQFAHQVILQPAATTVTLAAGANALSTPFKQIDYGTNTYLLEAGRYVHRLTGANQWLDVLDLGAGNQASDAVNQGGYIAVSEATSYVYATTGASYNAWTNASTAADRFGTLRDLLWRAVRPNSIFSATSPAAAWSASSTIADASFNINSLSGLEQLLLIGKEDGVYSIDFEGLVVPFTPELRPQYNSNFAAVNAVTTFNGDYYFRTLNGIVQINGADGTKHKVGFDQLASPDIPTPVVKALTSDDRFLYALAANSSNGLMILRRNIQGAWNPYYWDPNAGAGSHIAVSGALGFPALFFSYGSPILTKYIRLATFANPLDDANYTYDSVNTGWIRAPRIGSASEAWSIDRIAVLSTGATANQTITVFAAVDGGAVAQVGSVVTTSPSAIVLPTNPLVGNLFDFYFYLSSNAAASTPVLRGFHITGFKRPLARRSHMYMLLLDTFHVSRRDGQMMQSTLGGIADLQTLRTTTTICTLTDENQQTADGFVIGIANDLKDLKPADREPTRIVRLTFLEKAAN